MWPFIRVSRLYIHLRCSWDSSRLKFQTPTVTAVVRHFVVLHTIVNVYDKRCPLHDDEDTFMSASQFVSPLRWFHFLQGPIVRSGDRSEELRHQIFFNSIYECQWGQIYCSTRVFHFIWLQHWSPFSHTDSAPWWYPKPSEARSFNLFHFALLEQQSQNFVKTTNPLVPNTITWTSHSRLKKLLSFDL